MIKNMPFLPPSLMRVEFKCDAAQVVNYLSRFGPPNDIGEYDGVFETCFGKGVFAFGIKIDDQGNGTMNLRDSVFVLKSLIADGTLQLKANQVPIDVTYFYWVSIMNPNHTWQEDWPSPYTIDITTLPV